MKKDFSRPAALGASFIAFLLLSCGQKADEAFRLQVDSLPMRSVVTTPPALPPGARYSDESTPDADPLLLYLSHFALGASKLYGTATASAYAHLSG